ncbi:uncharacterized protein LOC142349648 isoform X2 [Convolutriloba macropyga]|uniref:uncharacterized protein LOC142349648 isoform X2 n=1 Tax=Convolutriloba macropyga TaxID=536237 RepID=UPI003F51EB62
MFKLSIIRKMGHYTASMLMLVLPLGFVAAQVDLTLEPNATGCEVAMAVIDKINLFTDFSKQHKFLLNRIAYMYDFGEDELPPDGIGMWGITMQNFNYIRGEGWSVNWKRFLNQFDFSTLQEEDIFKPYYNGLAAFLLIQSQSSNVPARSKPDEQYQFWVTMTGIDLSNGKYSQNYFVEKSSDLNSEECMECDQPPSDVVFVFDDSGSIGNDGFEQQKGFIRTVVSHLSDTLATDESKLALVVFSTTVIFTMPYTSSESTFLAALNGLPHTGQRTNLAQALLSAASIVRTDPNSRKAEKLIDDIVVFSIGMTSGAVYGELLKAATSEDYVLQYSTFDQFTDEVDDILYQTCQITPTPVTIGGVSGFSVDITGLLKDDKRVVQMTFPDDSVLLMQMSTSTNGDSEVEVIYNCDGSPPNKARYFGSFTLALNQNQSSIEFVLECVTQRERLPRERFRRSVNINETAESENSTVVPGNITAAVAFIFVNTSDDCQLCSIDLSLNITQVDIVTWLSWQEPVVEIPEVVEDIAQDIVPEDTEDWLLLVLIVLLSIGICAGVVTSIWCMVRKCIEIKNNQTVGAYDEHRDAYKTNETPPDPNQLPKWSIFHSNPIYSSKNLNSTQKSTDGELKSGFHEKSEEDFVPVFKIPEGPNREW